MSRSTEEGRSGRVLGLDPGKRRIGVALSDDRRLLATGILVIDRKTKDPKRVVARLVKENEVALVVVGLPLNADGSEGPSAMAARAFGDSLGCPVVYHDERYTTVIADDILKEAGLDGKKRRGVVDKLAAQIMLQGYLDEGRG